MGEGQEGDKSADKLIESLREFVQEQGRRRPTHKNEERPPDWKDWARLALLIGAAVSLYSLIPDDAKGPVEFLNKFVPWLLGGLWAVVNAWSRHTLLQYNRKPWATIVEAAVLLAIAPHWLRIYPVAPMANPSDSPILIDGESVPYGEPYWLTLRDHKVTLKRGEESPDSPKPPMDREFHLGWREFLRVPFVTRELELRQTYMVHIRALNAPTKVTVTVTIKDPKARFDDAFLKPYNLQRYGYLGVRRLPEKDKDYYRALAFDLENSAVVADLWLPVGNYNVAMSGCEVDPEVLTAAPGAPTKTLSPCTPKRKP